MRRWALLVLLCAGCDAGGGSLIVGVITDYRIPAEADGTVVVLTSVDGARFGEISRPIEGGGASAVRVAEFEGVPRGNWLVEASLTRGGAEVGRGLVQLETTGGAGSTTVIVSRECAGVVCPDGGDPSLTACLGGRCVDPRCSPEDPSSCPVICSGPADCTPSVECDAVRCVASACVSFFDDAMCAAGTCDPTIGCVADEVDAGVADSGPADGGPDAAPGVDSGVDGGPPLVALEGVTEVVVGYEHSCALVAGEVFCWGRNDSGQLGDGTNARRRSAVPVVGLDQVSALALGLGHTCAIRLGEVFCWGNNEWGQLSSGLGVDSNVPVAVGLSGATSIGAGHHHTCAILPVDTRCWGQGGAGQLGRGNRIVINPSPGRYDSSGPFLDIDGSASFSCAVIAGGGVECAGSNFDGNHGDGTTDNHDSPAPATLSGATDLDLGFGHTCVITSPGPVLCFGRNDEGQLGDGTTTDSSLPVAVSGVAGVDQISLGSDHGCALDAGRLDCWGHNDRGQVGDGTTVDQPTPLNVRSGVVQVSCGRAHTCALEGGGRVQCWGANDVGQLGDGSQTDRSTGVTVLR